MIVKAGKSKSSLLASGKGLCALSSMAGGQNGKRGWEEETNYDKPTLEITKQLPWWWHYSIISYLSQAPNTVPLRLSFWHKSFEACVQAVVSDWLAFPTEPWLTLPILPQGPCRSSWSLIHRWSPQGGPWTAIRQALWGLTRPGSHLGMKHMNNSSNTDMRVWGKA
jgi:hypothetical protein